MHQGLPEVSDPESFCEANEPWLWGGPIPLAGFSVHLTRVCAARLAAWHAVLLLRTSSLTVNSVLPSAVSTRCCAVVNHEFSN